MRMNAAETSASSAIADCTPLTVVSRSLTTDEIDTFISEVSTTRTNIAIASSRPSRPGPASSSATGVVAIAVTFGPTLARGPGARITHTGWCGGRGRCGNTKAPPERGFQWAILGSNQ